MKEDFLHYVWRFKKLKTSLLKTEQGNNLIIKDFGMYLGNQGPDFFNAQIYIDDQLWAGNVEMHVNASDWYAHHHEVDSSYDNVILHVVWNNDSVVFRADGSEIPTLVLKQFINDEVYTAYNRFLNNPQFIFCEQNIDTFSNLDWLIFKEKLIIERLEEFTNRIVAELKDTNNNWEEVFYRLLLRNFGLNINSDAFYEISKNLPLKVLRKEQGNVTSLEALIFGTANLLDNSNEDYYLKSLQKTYRFLKEKYKLENNSLSPTFYKLRPDNFPTIRLSQFVSFIYHQTFIFDLVQNPETLTSNNYLQNVSVQPYWKTHYVFGKEHIKRIKNVSNTFYELLLINTILPFQYVYHHQMGNDVVDEILNHYQNIDPEKNNIVEMFQKLNAPIKNALDTQSILFLKKNYCDLKRCLQCDIGIKIMGR